MHSIDSKGGMWQVREQSILFCSAHTGQDTQEHKFNGHCLVEVTNPFVKTQNNEVGSLGQDDEGNDF